MGPRRPLLVVLFLTIFTAIIFVARYGTEDGGNSQQIAHILEKVTPKPRPRPRPKPSHPLVPSEEFDWLAPYELSYPIQYVARDIITVPSSGEERPSLTVVDETLFDKLVTIEAAHTSPTENVTALPPLRLQVPRNKKGPTDASNMIFGLQTTMNRLRDTVPHLQRWLPYTGARLIAIVVESEEVAVDDVEISWLEQHFHEKGMNVTIVHPVRKEDSFPQRYFSLVSLMYAARDENTQWVTLIDDDTLFPSLSELQTELRKHDPSVPQYIGSLSEDWWAVKHYGLMGFGGASIILSIPMAKIMEDNYEDCKYNIGTSAGDITVMDCIYRHSSVKLTSIEALHQVDMHGDLSGFYESGRRILSTHHWKLDASAGYQFRIEKMHLVANICDTCFLQRWQFKDTVLSNGYSISVYPNGQLSGQSGLLGTGVGHIDKLDFELMEETWADDIDVRHSLGPTRPKVDAKDKISYKLLDSIMMKSNPNIQGKGDIVRQIYFRQGLVEEDGEQEMDTIMVLNWRQET